MRRISPDPRVAIIIEAIAKLRFLEREMNRLSARDENYKSNRHALQAAIRELQMLISANMQ
jgi:hypothetical protein